MQLTHKAGLALALLTVAGTAVSPAHASGPNLVTNPGFETGFTGYTIQHAASGSDLLDSFSNPHSGNNAALFGGTSPTPNDDDSISQNLTTVAGQTYDISFFLANNNGVGGNNNDFHADFGGTSLLNLSNAPAFAYTQYHFTEMATGAATPLEFGGRNVPGGAYFSLDDISVTAGSPVPEASTTISFGLLLCLGLGGLAWSARRKKAQAGE